MASVGIGLASSPLSARETDARRYSSELLKPHLVAVERSRRLNIVCFGQGRPTVVFEQGLGGNLLDWKDVIAETSKMTRTCVYDRAGYGFSDPAVRASDALNATSDLHALLKAAHVTSPVVLVGHSIGGLFATLYVDRFPHEVAGLVLVDPSYAGQTGLQPETPEEIAMIKKHQAESASKDAECAESARRGLLTQDDMKGCLPPMRRVRPPEEVAYLQEQYRRPGIYGAMRSEQDNFGPLAVEGEPVDSRQERAARRDFGSMPLIVLSRDKRPQPPTISAARWNTAEADWLSGHVKLAARSTKGHQTVVPGAGHYIQVDQPKSVIDAVAEVVQEARGH
jgi:pimeloyl-ACP methyl ester carboxylesterase